MANRYARAVGGNWTDNATWSTTSGGAADTVAPTASDDVFLDANSGQVTISATSVGKSLTCTGYTGTLTHNAFTLTISGSITFVSGMVYAPSASTNNLVMNVANGTLTTGGQLLPNFLSDVGITTTLGDNVAMMASKTVTFRVGNALNLNGKTLSGNSVTNRVLIHGKTLGTAVTITNTTGTFANADFRDITFSSVADYSAITGGSGDCGGNTNATFTTPATQTATGNSANWSTTTWTSRVPLPQDDVVLSLTAGQTLTNDMPRMGKSISVTTAMILITGVAATNYGSLDLTNLTTFTQSSTFTFEGRGNFNLTSAGKSFTQDTTISMVGGKLTLLDAMTVTTGTASNLTNGEFDANDFNVTLSSGIASGTAAHIVRMGNGTWTLTRTAAGSAWVTTAGTTVHAENSTILISNTGANSKTFAGGGLTYNNLSISGGGAGAVILTGANTFNRIYTDGGGTKTITFPASTTTTLSSTSNDNFGNGNNLLTIASSSGGSAFTISKPIGRFEGDYLNLTDSTATGTFYAGEHSVNVSGNSGWIFSAFSPNQSGGKTMWLDALDGGDGTFIDRLTKTAYTATSVTRGANVCGGTEMIFNGTSSKIECGNIGEIYSCTFWVKAGNNSCSLIDFNGTEYISLVNGTVTATSWTSPTIYVNGVVTSVLPTNEWCHVAVTSTTSVTASTVILGLIGSSYGDCSLTNIVMYDRVLSATDVGRQVPSFPSANRALLQDLLDYTGLTFYKNYGIAGINTVNADYSSGSATGTWTVTRGSTTPATYCDADGTIQLVTGTNPRFTAGFYDTTGFVSRPGLIVEGASTNILPRSDGSSSAGTIWTSWAGLEDVDTGTTTYDNTNTPSISGISGAKTQRLVGSDITVATNKSHYVYCQTTAGSIANATTYTASAWVKINSISGVNVQISVRTLNNPVTAVQETFASSSLSAVSGWVRIQKTFTTNDVDTSACYFRLDVINIDAGDSYDVEFYAPQLEALPFASTFIPTTTAALTRNAETLTYPIASNRTAATESLFLKHTTFANFDTLTANQLLTGTTTKSRQIGISSSSDDYYFGPNITDTVGALARTAPTLVDVVAGTVKVICGVAVSTTGDPNSAIYVDGTSYAGGTPNTDWTSPAWGNSFGVGSDGGGESVSYGIISSLAIFSDAKDATAVAGITDLLETL